MLQLNRAIRQRFGLVAHLALVGGLVASPSQAQGVAQGVVLEELVVTAQRRSQSIQDVPISVTAIGADAITKQNIQTIEDYFAITPNVSFVNNGSRDRRDLSIRGISNQLGAYDDVRPAAYAFYINEFNVIAGTSNPEILDLERIEVLRGPQGTYFGRNAVGGAINIQTKKPDDEWFGQVGAGYASFNTRRFDAIANVPVVEGLLAFRAAGQIEKTDGSIKNINALGGGNEAEYKTARVIARLTPNERFTWDLTYSYTDEETGMRSGVPTGVLTATWRSLYYQNRPGDIADPDGVGFFPANRSQVNFDRPQKVGSKFQYVSSNMVYNFDAATLTAVAGYLDSKVFNYGDVDGSSHDFFYEDFNLDRDSVSGELRLQSTAEGPIEWSVGAMYGRDSGQTDQATYYGTQNPLGQVPGKTITTFVTDSTSTYHAVFAQGTWHFAERWSVVAGGRYSYEKIDRHLINTSNGVQTNDSRREKSFKDFSPSVTVSVKPTDDSLLYATVSKGFKSGGVQTSELSLKNDYAPETLWNYELGAKFELFDRRLRFDGSVFYMDWKNVQQSVRFQYLDGGKLVSVSGIDNAAKAYTYGAEVNVDALLTPQLRVGATGGWLEAKYDKYEAALIDGAIINASGRRMINAPRWTLSANAEYTVPLFADYAGFVRGEWNYRGESLSSNYALRYPIWPFISPGYHNVNLRLGIENEHLRVIAFAENLFDAKYFSNAYEKAFYSGVQVEPSHRRFGVNLSYKFF